MSTDPLLLRLADGEFHSGEELGELLGISRTAVWKQLQKLDSNLGLNVEKRRGLGYRIDGGLDLLAADQISEAYLNWQSQHGASIACPKLCLHSEIDSTNAELLRGAISGDRDNIACSAESQNAGRGRLGRRWHSPYARNLYFSLIREFYDGAAALEGLSLVVGVAIARELKRLGLHVALKWPNDVLVDGSKLAGILLEMQGDADGCCQLVIGVGLNVSMGDIEQSAIDQAWTDLDRQLPSRPSRSALLGCLLASINHALDEFSRSGFGGFREEWQRYDAFFGKPVVLTMGAQQRRGIAAGVSEHGALLLETDGEVQRFHGGELSLRPAN